MPRNTNLHENRMFTNKVNLSIILVQKGKSLRGKEKRVGAKNISLIYLCKSWKRCLEGPAIKD